MRQRTRTFIALPMEEEPKNAMTRLFGDLQEVFPKVRWVRAENLHITLAFLGEVETTQIPELCEKVGMAAGEHDAYFMEIHGLGAFPNPHRPRTLWIGVREGSDETTALQSSIAHTLEPLGFRRENRPFVPHLTIGRLRYPPKPNEHIRATFDEFADWHAGTCSINEVLVMGSELSPAGPAYTVLGRLPLGGT